MKSLFRICFWGLLLSLVIGTIGVKAGTDYKVESVRWSNGTYGSDAYTSGIVTTGVCATYTGLSASWSYDVYGLSNFLYYNTLPSTHYYEFKKGSSLVKGGTYDGDLSEFMLSGVDRSHDDDSDTAILAFSVTTAVHIHQGNTIDIHTTAKATR